MEKKSLNASQKMKKTPIGKIPVDWSLIHLGENIEEASERNTKDDNSLPVLSVTNTQGFVMSEQYFDKKVYSKDLSNYKIVSRGQFAYNPSRINVGSIAHLREFEKGLLSPMYVVFEAKNTLDSDYLDYWISSQHFLNLVKASTQGTVRDSLKFSALAEFLFILPPITEQHKISSILASIDSVIKKTQSVVDQTQTLKKGLMQELFTRGIPGRHKKFKKTEIGEIPTEWKVIKLRNCVDINPEQLGNKTDENLLIKYLDISGISQTGIIGEMQEYEFKNAPGRARRKVQDGDIVVSTVRPYLRAFAYIKDCPINLVVSTGFAVLRPKDKDNTRFIYHQILNDKFVEFLLPRMTGSNYPAVRPEDVGDYKIGYPINKEELYRISNILTSIDNKLEYENNLLKTFDSFKSALMQVLLTGKVRVKV